MAIHSRIVAAAATSDKSARGSEVQTCRHCRKAAHDTRVSVSNGMRLIRIRFGVPECELPDRDPSELDQHLKFLLLEGRRRPSVRFPRRQKPGKVSPEGFVTLERLWRRERWELAHSLSSLKRNLPSGCPVHRPSKQSSWVETVTHPPSPSSPEFVSFVRREILRMFPYGWDRQYERFVGNFVPQPSARFEPRSRADLECAALGEGNFRRHCLTGRGFDTGPLKARYKEVLSAGKVRPLTIFENRNDYLGPLHKLIYDHLSSFDWLLVGTPTERRLSSTLIYDWQTSIDLVSATDNLSVTVASLILECLLSKASMIPAGIRLLAVNSLTPHVYLGGDRVVEVTHGQMMGSYLSFPLLCLQSYIAARWATRGVSAKILVNGDDTLISCNRPIRYEEYPPGFVMNDLKTIRSQKVAEINSTCFLKGGKGKWVQVRHLRRGSGLADFPGMLHFAAAVRGDVKWTDAFIRSRIGKAWGLTPLQLQLHPKSYPCFQRTRDLHRRRLDTALPAPAIGVQEGLRVLQGNPSAEEVFALSEFLRNNGRQGGRKRDVWRPSLGAIRRSFRYRRSEPRYLLSWDRGRSLIRAMMTKRTSTYFVPAEYVTREENEGLRELDAWKQAVAESADA
nr:MAG: RNA-dependent RNA polymerase [Xiaogan botourmia-like virus 1]